MNSGSAPPAPPTVLILYLETGHLCRWLFPSSQAARVEGQLLDWRQISGGGVFSWAHPGTSESWNVLMQFGKAEPQLMMEHKAPPGGVRVVFGNRATRSFGPEVSAADRRSPAPL